MQHEFSGDQVVVTYDDTVCIHAGNCVRQLPAVFNLDHDPWINPSGTPIADIEATVNACPSGALGIRSSAA